MKVFTALQHRVTTTEEYQPIDNKFESNHRGHNKSGDTNDNSIIHKHDDEENNPGASNEDDSCPFSSPFSSPPSSPSSSGSNDADDVTQHWLAELLPSDGKLDRSKPSTNTTNTSAPSDKFNSLNDSPLLHQNNVDEDSPATNNNDNLLLEMGRIEPSIDTIIDVDALVKIDPQPVEIVLGKNRNKTPILSWIYKTSGIVLGLLIVLLLPFQLTLNNPDLVSSLLPSTLQQEFKRLQRSTTWRQTRQFACQFTHCPIIANADSYQTRQLMVYSHPETKNALMVEIIILNQSPHSLPFPNVALYFTDTHNRAVAQRVFSPEEYLSGEMQGKTSMPIATPIHLALAIKDPGVTAVNYTVELSPPR